MLGFLSAILAGAAMSVQGVMNTRLGEKGGADAGDERIRAADRFFAGAAHRGFLRQRQHPTIAASAVVCVAGRCTRAGYHADGDVGDWQPDTNGRDFRDSARTDLTVAALIDVFGWLGAEKMPFSWEKWVGVALMVGGVILMKIKT